MASFITKATGFPFMSRKWDPKEGIPRLDGKVAIVTGGNTGLGYITAFELAAKGAKVYIACRSAERAKAAIERLTKEIPTPINVIHLQFDLTDIKSAQAAAKEIIDKENRLDIVVASAAVMATPYRLVNGIELQFCNHTGHFAFIQPLLPLLIKTSKEADAHVRIVNVSSLGHNFTSKPDFSTLEMANRPLGSTWVRYGQSKLANILYTISLQEHLKNEKIRVIALHPGNVATELTRGPAESYPILGWIMTKAANILAMTPYEGAKTQLYAAASPEVDELDLKAAYLVPIATVSTTSVYAQDPELAQQLWNLSHKIVADATHQI